MVCTECGARISEEDQFCPKCGAKVIKKRRCPDCGAPLRQDNKFCPKCGRLVGEKKTAKAVSQDTMDIPMESIERNILSETAAEIRTDRREERTAHKRSSSVKSRSGQEEPVRRKKAEPPVQKKKSQPAPPPKKKRPVYREEIEEEDNWEDDDWEDEDWDDEEEGTDILTIMTAVMGCVVLIIVAFVAFRLYQQYVPKNYDKVAKEQEEAEEDSKGDQEEGQPEQDAEQSEDAEPEGAILGTLTISKNVNVRDNPSTSGSNVIKVAQAGESYEYLEVIDDGEWYKIALSEDGYTEGYVFAEYVTVD